MRKKAANISVILEGQIYYLAKFFIYVFPSILFPLKLYASGHLESI